MKWKSLFLLLMLGAVNGCSHLQRGSDDSAVLLPASDSATVTKDTQTTPPAVEQLQEQQQEPDTPDDLYQRLIKGFRFTDYTSPHIDKYLKWNTTHPSYLDNLFTRGSRYLYYIVEEIEKRDLPMEIALLPAVESAFKPNAYSRSKAAGLWQFIPSTGRHFNLHQDWWYDGRKDVVAATNAALDYLEQLNRRFDGDWFLTLAAYNAGQGTISRAIKTNRRKGLPTDYKHLKLRSETRRYIPKLLALKKIVSNPAHYGVTLPDISNTPVFAIEPLNRQVDLNELSKQSGIKLDTLKALNPGFLRWASPPYGKHHLLVPLANSAQTRTYLAQVKNQPSIQFRHHKIKTGENLSTIAKRYGVSVRALKQSNRIRGSFIRAGKHLVIPIPAVGLANSSTHGTSDQPVVHRVKRGDTLWSIARQYQVKIHQLLAWNDINKDAVLSLRQPLTIYR